MISEREEGERALRQALADALEGVGKDSAAAIAGLNRRARLNRRMLRWLTALSAAMAITIGFMIAAIIAVAHTSSDLESVQNRTSDKVLCPLYGAFLAAANNPVPDNIKNNPRELRERAEAFKIIEMGAKELGCFGR